VPSWMWEELVPEHIRVHKVSGSLTNAVFFISYNPSATTPLFYTPQTVLLRIYGPSSSALINRPQELRILYTLSSTYGLGPCVFGTFGNGRVEEYFESQTLTAPEMRDPTISRWIGKNMRDLHSVDIATVVGGDSGYADGEIAARKNVREWAEPARDVLRALDERLARLRSSNPGVNHVWSDVKSTLDFERLMQEWEMYRNWVQKWEEKHGKSPRVFAHNDAQYGNLLRLKNTIPTGPAYQQIIVVDFEYAAPNPAAFDIANHFHEWCTEYNSATSPHISHLSRYPTPAERAHFYRAYLGLPSTECESDVKGKARVADLEAHVRVWAPASSLMWTVWAIVQARDDVLAEGSLPGEFDYLGYAKNRAEIFRQGLKSLGVTA